MNQNDVNNDYKIIANSKFSIIGLVISILNTAYCIITVGVIAVTLFGEIFSARTGNASGWFLFVAPFFVALYFASCIPDFLCLVFSILYKKKNKIKFLILTIILAIIGCLIMNSQLMKELLYGSMHTIIYIYTAFKGVIVVYNVILLIMAKSISAKKL